MKYSNVEKKREQLGMHPSTASARLLRDTLWRFIERCGGTKCSKCGEDMTRENYSVEHKEAWLDSADPVGFYFNQDNITFSHLSCNIKASRNGPKIRFGCGTYQSYHRGCRCDPCRSAKAAYRREKS